MKNRFVTALPKDIPSNDEYRERGRNNLKLAAQHEKLGDSITAGMYYWDCISCLNQLGESKTTEDENHIRLSYLALGIQSKNANNAAFARFYFKNAGVPPEMIQAEERSAIVTSKTEPPQLGIPAKKTKRDDLQTDKEDISMETARTKRLRT